MRNILFLLFSFFIVDEQMRWFNCFPVEAQTKRGNRVCKCVRYKTEFHVICPIRLEGYGAAKEDKSGRKKEG